MPKQIVLLGEKTHLDLDFKLYTTDKESQVILLGVLDRSIIITISANDDAISKST